LFSQDRTKKEAIGNIGEASKGHGVALEEDNLPVAEEKFDALPIAA
jgi:hypothetical protein